VLQGGQGHGRLAAAVTVIVIVVVVIVSRLSLITHTSVDRF
jgi:hypothetical protein